MKRFSSIAYASVLGGILIHLAVFTVIRIQGPVERPQFEQPAEIHFVGKLDAATQPSILQQAALYDSAPLFMPTQWNLVSEMSEVASLKGATELFAAFPASLQIRDARPPPPVAYAQESASLTGQLPDGPAFVLSRMGLDRQDLPVAASAGPTVVVERLDSGARMPDQGRLLPETFRAEAPPALWSPVQFHFQLSDGWPVGLPVLAQSSGFPDWDDNLRDFVGSLGFYRDLDDGYYRLSVFP